MIIKDFHEERVLTQQSDVRGVIIIDEHGNKWRVYQDSTSPHGGLAIMIVETSQGHLASLSIIPKSGNVIEVKPA